MSITITFGAWMLPLALMWFGILMISIINTVRHGFDADGFFSTVFSACVITFFSLLTRFLP